MRGLYQACLLACGLAIAGPALAQGPLPASGVDTRSVSEWLVRMHEAARGMTYIGTFVVSSASGGMSSARIWHACDGVQQIERVEALTGAPRSTFRRNDQVITFLPESRIARTEKRESLGLFPGLLQGSSATVGDFYVIQKSGVDRVAGFESEVVHLMPKDQLRFGYRIWSERRTGLVVKLQTLSPDGQVLEQSAFSELQMDAPVKMDKLAAMMANTDGYRVEKVEPVKTTAAAEGWFLRNPVAGFKAVTCYKRPGNGASGQDGAVQWIFSDGLASVSLFLEAFDRQRHPQEALMSMGATQTLTRRLPDKGGDWWLTVVGEVPVQTLKAFAQALERRK